MSVPKSQILPRPESPDQLPFPKLWLEKSLRSHTGFRLIEIANSGSGEAANLAVNHGPPLQQNSFPFL
jgi:hypothetical protein